MNLLLDSKLVDIKSNKIVGLLYKDVDVSFPRLVPFKLQVAKDLGLQDSDIAEFMDVKSIDVVIHNNTYALVSNALCILDDKDVPFEKVDEKTAIWGHLFERCSLVDFINSLEEADYGEDNLC